MLELLTLGKAECVPGNGTHRSNTKGVTKKLLVIRRDWLDANQLH